MRPLNPTDIAAVLTSVTPLMAEVRRIAADVAGQLLAGLDASLGPRPGLAGSRGLWRRWCQLARAGGHDPRRLVKQLAREAAWQALLKAGEPRYVRIGLRWIRDRDGRRRRVAPIDLPFREFRRWWRAETYRRLRALVKIEEPPPRVSPPTRRQPTRRAPAPSVSAARTPRQRHILMLARRGWTAPQIAAALSLSPATVRVHLLRLRRRAQ
jgi:DNA-binding CsgD family transcriptional regulator